MMCGLIDLNTVDNDDVGEETTTPVSLDSPATSSAASGSSDLTSSTTPAVASVCMELWHACAGPLISLPKKGSAVVYLPQGHLEHISEYPPISFNLPPHVFCRVVDVKLQVSMRYLCLLYILLKIWDRLVEVFACVIFSAQCLIVENFGCLFSYLAFGCYMCLISGGRGY